MFIRLFVFFFMVAECISEALRYEPKSKPPNILFIVADDLGYNDVGWHNPLMPTPNLNRLRENNTITLENYYVQYVCTPSRTAFLTGMYPYHLGLQHYVIEPKQPNSVPLDTKLLPQYLKDLSYSTHAIGKWHLGFCNWNMTPTYRGFDSFYGFYSGENDYFQHAWAPENTTVGLDFRDDTSLVRDQNGTYSVFSFTKRAQHIIGERHDRPFYMYLAYQNIHTPLQVPEEYLDERIENKERRYTTAMVKILDEAIGNLTQSLKHSGHFDDTIIVFTTDNGGRVDEGGNNWPLRGSKLTIWEGGAKGVAFIRYSSFLRSYDHHGLFHAVDWLPTLVQAAGGRVTSIDGVAQWHHLIRGSGSARNEFLYNIDEIDNMAAIRVGDYKLIVGETGIHNGWYPALDVLTSQDGRQALTLIDDYGDLITKTTGENNVKLFNLKHDPYERLDISQSHPRVVDDMMKRLKRYNQTIVPAYFPAETESADPKHFHNSWSPGWC